MSSPDAVPLPRLGEVFFDVRGNSRSMRLSWYSDSAVAVFSIWQGSVCTGTFRLAIDDLPRMVQLLTSGPAAAVLAGEPEPASQAGPVPRHQQGYQREPGHGHRSRGEPDPAYPGVPETGYGLPGQPGQPGGEYQQAGYLDAAGEPRPGYPGGSYRQSAGHPGQQGYPGIAAYPGPAAYPPEPAAYRPEPAAYPPEPAGFPSGHADPAGYAQPGTRGGYRHADTAPADGSYQEPDRNRAARGSQGYAGSEAGRTDAHPRPDSGYRDRGGAEPYGSSGTVGNGYRDDGYAAPGGHGNGYAPGQGDAPGDPAERRGRDGRAALRQADNRHFAAGQPGGYPDPGYPESSGDGNHHAASPAWPGETAGGRYLTRDDSATQIRPNGYAESAGAEGVLAADSHRYSQLAASASGARRRRDSRQDIP